MERQLVEGVFICLSSGSSCFRVFRRRGREMKVEFRSVTIDDNVRREDTLVRKWLKHKKCLLTQIAELNAILDRERRSASLCKPCSMTLCCLHSRTSTAKSLTTSFDPEVQRSVKQLGS